MFRPQQKEHKRGAKIRLPAQYTGSRELGLQHYHTKLFCSGIWQLLLSLSLFLFFTPVKILFTL